jgi:hypothetical protein
MQNLPFKGNCYLRDQNSRNLFHEQKENPLEKPKINLNSIVMNFMIKKAQNEKPIQILHNTMC